MDGEDGGRLRPHHQGGLVVQIGQLQDRAVLGRLESVDLVRRGELREKIQLKGLAAVYPEGTVGDLV